MSRKLLRAFALGGLAGAALASWLAPSVIVWYFQPPVEMGFSCKAPIEWALDRLRLVQGIGLALGGLLAIAGYSLFAQLAKSGTDRGPERRP